MEFKVHEKGDMIAEKIEELLEMGKAILGEIGLEEEMVEGISLKSVHLEGTIYILVQSNNFMVRDLAQYVNQLFLQFNSSKNVELSANVLTNVLSNKKDKNWISNQTGNIKVNFNYDTAFSQQLKAILCTIAPTKANSI